VSGVIEIGLSLPVGSDEAGAAIRAQVETLARVNVAYLKRHPTPPLRKAGIRYIRERGLWGGRPRRERWQSIPEVLKNRGGDCEDLAAWRIAELRVRGIPAQARIETNHRGGWHITVKIKGFPGWYCDPSKELGMGRR